MQNTIGASRPQSFRWVVAAFVVGGIVLAAVVGASIWQSSLHSSDKAAMEDHAAAAALLQQAGEEAAVAAPLLRQYVEGGDETLIAQIKAHAASGVESLTGAVAKGGASDLNPLAVGGARLAESAGGIIGLRQNGDVKAAAAALEALSPEFDQFTIQLEAAISAELAEASSLQSSADSADKLASQLLVASIVIGVVLGLGAAAVVVRSLLGRRIAKTAAPI